MKLLFILRNEVWTKHVLAGLFWVSYFSAGAQNNSPTNESRINVSPTREGRVRVLKSDTLDFHKLYLRFQEEVQKRGALNVDSLIHFGHAAIAEANSIGYKEGLIKLYLGLGAGFVDKVMIDSALYYTKLATLKAPLYSSSNAHLKAQAYMGYAWTLVYDNSNYQEAMQSASLAQRTAFFEKDTLLWIEMTTKLIKICYEASYMSRAFRNCTELNKVCEIKKDTVALVNSYSMLGEICASMYLYEKQKKMVHKILELKGAKRDTNFAYNINNALAKGYLISKQYDSVLYYARLNLPLCFPLKRMPYCYATIAKAFLEMNHLDSARYYYNLIMDYHIGNGSYIDTYLYLDLGKIEAKSDNNEKALVYFKKAEADISKPNLRTQMEIYRALYEFYDRRHENENSLLYLKKYKVWSDSILNNRFGISVLEYESSLLTEEKLVLRNEKEIQAIRAATQIQQKKIGYAVMGFLIIIAGLGFNRFRVLRDLKYKQTLTNDRLRISRELHDEVGATLSGIAMYSHVARDQVQNAKIKEAEHSLSFMQKSAGEMVQKLSDIVWLINPEQDTILELFGRLGEYGKQMTQVKGMQMKLDLPKDLSGVHMPLEARRNIYLICKEAINNAVKYSHGKVLQLRVELLASEFVFSVQDDGQGFDDNLVKRGNGLTNMEKRAEEIGAKVDISSSPGQGTRIALHYKIIH